MSQAFFEDLELPKPDHFLSGGSGSHAVQTAKIMTEFEKICMEERPDVVMVVGDVNSTLACSIVAKKMMIKVAHVEAGLRSFDMGMPEEINRLVTDSISDYYFVTEQSAIDNLRREGKRPEDIFFVGHVMIDNLLYQLDQLEKDLSGHKSFMTYELKHLLGRYIFMTLHRPSNVDEKDSLVEIADAIETIAAEVPVVFPVHPRTKKKLEEFNIPLNENVHLLAPLSFKESLFLWKDAELVMTDSGGLQEETTGIGIPCLTLRDNTERPVTVEQGTNSIVGNRKDGILKGFRNTKGRERRTLNRPPKWDGRAAERIVEVLSNFTLYT
jgi:UDP-N-acetylglucosamine 2-epimerase (non-hydrolysing)